MYSLFLVSTSGQKKSQNDLLSLLPSSFAFLLPFFPFNIAGKLLICISAWDVSLKFQGIVKVSWRKHGWDLEQDFHWNFLTGQLYIAQLSRWCLGFFKLRAWRSYYCTCRCNYSFELKNVLPFFDLNLYGFMDDVSNSNMLWLTQERKKLLSKYILFVIPSPAIHQQYRVIW